MLCLLVRFKDMKAVENIMEVMMLLHRSEKREFQWYSFIATTGELKIFTA